MMPTKKEIKWKGKFITQSNDNAMIQETNWEDTMLFDIVIFIKCSNFECNNNDNHEQSTY